MDMYTRTPPQRLEVRAPRRQFHRPGRPREVIANVRGDGVYRDLGYEAAASRPARSQRPRPGTHPHLAATVAVCRSRRMSRWKSTGKRTSSSTSAAPAGPGGQNVNKVASAIKLEHTPTGITVSMRDEKSQHKNRAKARRILATRVADHFRSKQVAAEAATRKSMIGSGDRSQRIRTYNFPQNRCTDHRLKGRLRRRLRGAPTSTSSNPRRRPSTSWWPP